MEIALLGHMGRDHALADKLVSQGNRLHVIGQWHNPGLVENVEKSGGSYFTVNKITNVGAITDVVEHLQPDMFLTNFEDALAAGVVNVIENRMRQGAINSDLLIPCPDKAGSKIEWDKFFLRELIDEIDPTLNPQNCMANSSEKAEKAIREFEESGIEVVVKPRAPTGGSGVKVMGEHLKSYEAARVYAVNNAEKGGAEIQEKLEGVEFTLQFYTDGVNFIDPPVTYDYPYRKDGDTGPGTGGTGVFTISGKEILTASGDPLQFFVEPKDYRRVKWATEQVLLKLEESGVHYRGMIYPSFFKTKNGLKIVEFNARGGEGELINILDLMEDDVDIAQVLRQVAEGDLRPDSIRYKKLASTLVYFMVPQYGYTTGPQFNFRLNREAVTANGCLARFAATELLDRDTHMYKTVGTSRSFGLFALGDSPWEAREKIHTAAQEALDSDCPLEFRRDIGAEEYIIALNNR